jgi:hydrogenase-4 component F
MALLILIMTPLIAALVSLAVRREVRPLELITALAAPCEFAAVVIVAISVFYDGRYQYGTYLSVDALGILVLFTVALVGFASACYSIGYLRQEAAKGLIGFRRMKQYYVLFHLFLMAMFYAVITVNPILMWIAIEATTLSTAFLISFYNKPTAMEAAWKYLIINSIGLLLGFFGTLLFFVPVSNTAADTFVTWELLQVNAASLNPLLVKTAFIFVLIGYGTKAGLAPMHTWLPDAHSKAPSPISALLSGALLNCALFAILKFKLITDVVLGASFTQNLLVFFGIISIAIPAFIIIVQKNYKRLFAYSSVEHMGIITLGFGFGGLGSFAALLHMIYHSLAKSILLFRRQCPSEIRLYQDRECHGGPDGAPGNRKGAVFGLFGDHRRASVWSFPYRGVYPDRRHPLLSPGRHHGAPSAGADLCRISAVYCGDGVRQTHRTSGAGRGERPDDSPSGCPAGAFADGQCLSAGAAERMAQCGRGAHSLRKYYERNCFHRRIPPAADNG